MGRPALPLLVFVLLLLLSGCSGVGYYSQLFAGQLSLLYQRQPIDQLLDNRSTEPELKSQLQKVHAIRQFAINQLALPNSSSYQYYNQLNRSHVLWNVFATEEFSVEAKRWCFPIAGCVGYRGYFSQRGALDYAEQLRGQGYDTFVGGVSAYSTLGWFADPVLSSFIYRDDAALAALIFHELAHQQLYKADDTAFNESFATAVEIAGVKRWYQQRAASSRSDGVSDDDAAAELAANMRRNYHQQRDFVALLLAARTELAALYQQDLPPAKMRLYKQAILTGLRDVGYRDFKVRWPGGDQYQYWFYPRADKQQRGGGPKNSAGAKALSQKIRVYPQPSNSSNLLAVNNAKLNTIASYNQWLPAFQALLSECEQDLECFYRRASTLATLDRATRVRRLQALSPVQQH